MKIVTWIIQILVAFSFIMSGFMKVSTPYEELSSQMMWVNSFSSTQVMIIGLLELLGGIGIIVPMFISSLKKLVPLAALGLCLDMIGAAMTHIIRGDELQMLGANAVLFTLSLIVYIRRRDMLKSS